MFSIIYFLGLSKKLLWFQPINLYSSFISEDFFSCYIGFQWTKHIIEKLLKSTVYYLGVTCPLEIKIIRLGSLK